MLLLIFCSLLHDDFSIFFFFFSFEQIKPRLFSFQACPLVSLFVFTYVLYLLFDIWTLFVPV